MDIKTVRDLIGAPESWPHDLNGAHHAMPDLQGAKLSHVIASDNQIAIQTQGPACGTTFSIFVI